MRLVKPIFYKFDFSHGVINHLNFEEFCDKSILQILDDLILKRIIQHIFYIQTYFATYILNTMFVTST